MKKIFLSALVAVAAVSGAVGYQTYQSNESTLSELGMANVDALTESEITDPRTSCETYCRTKAGYICVLYTNYGYTINCDECVTWNSSI